MVLVTLVLNGVAEANIGIVCSAVARSPLVSLVMKPLAAASLAIPVLIKRGSRKSIMKVASYTEKIGLFIKENFHGLAVGMIVANLWNKPDKSSRVMSSIYKFIPMPIRLILMLIVVGYLSPWVSRAWSRMTSLFSDYKQ